MNRIKSIVCALVVASGLVFSSCSHGDSSGNSIASVVANIGGTEVNYLAAAKLSNDGESSIPVVAALFGDSGTLIYGIDFMTGQKIYITYAGQKAGTYNTGVDMNSVGNDVLTYLIGAGSVSLTDSVKNAVKAASNVTFTDATGATWYSTKCSVVITSQVKGDRATLINGTFSANVYKDVSTSKTISGVITNVIGF